MKSPEQAAAELSDMLKKNGMTERDLSRAGLSYAISDLQHAGHDELSAAVVGVQRIPLSDEALADLLREEQLPMTPADFLRLAEEKFKEPEAVARKPYWVKKIASKLKKEER